MGRKRNEKFEKVRDYSLEPQSIVAAACVVFYDGTSIWLVLSCSIIVIITNDHIQTSISGYTST